MKGYFTVGLYDDGVPGEIFVDCGKEGDIVHGFADAWATAVSLLLQYGVDPRSIYDKFKFCQFEPQGLTNLKAVPMCKSMVDLIMRWMESNLPPTKKDNNTDGYDAVVEAVVDQ